MWLRSHYSALYVACCVLLAEDLEQLSPGLYGFLDLSIRSEGRKVVLQQLPSFPATHTGEQYAWLYRRLASFLFSN